MNDRDGEKESISIHAEKIGEKQKNKARLALDGLFRGHKEAMSAAFWREKLLHDHFMLSQVLKISVNIKNKTFTDTLKICQPSDFSERKKIL